MSKIIKKYQSICIAIGKLFPNHLEVILHDLNSGKIAFIVNSFSNRVIGDDSLIKMSELENDLDSNDVIGPYHKTNSDGNALKSISSLIRDNKNKPAALMCINFKTAEVNAALSLLTSLTSLSSQQDIMESQSLFAEDWREQVNLILAQTLQQLNKTLVLAKRKDKLEILKAIDKADIFEIRGSSNYVAQVLGISRANLYEILRDARK